MRSLRNGMVAEPGATNPPSVLDDRPQAGPFTGPAADGAESAGPSGPGTGSVATAPPGRPEVTESNIGDGAEGDDASFGVLDSAETFIAALNQTIAEAGAAQRTVFVFRIRGTAKGLLTWNDNPPIDVDLARMSVEQELLAAEPDLVLLPLADGELVGFDPDLKEDRKEADRLGGRLLSALATPMGDTGREFVVSIRLGAAIFNPDDGGAEQAMQAATQAVRQTSFATPFLIHNSYIADRSARLDQTGALLPEALEANQVMVEYQPRVSADERRITEIEVLPRWYHRDRGTIPPREFLRAAEKTGHLIELGRATRHEALSVAHKWQLSGILRGHRLWLNLAPVELCNTGFLDEVAMLVESRPYVALGFEVNDSGLLEDLMFLRIFDRLQELGVEIALDGVNHGSLSLGRLRRLPVTSINLDGELVRSLPGSAANRDLVRLLCASATERDQTVTACGIETTEQLEVAAVLGVDRLQGFGISKVLSQASMEEYLESAAQESATRESAVGESAAEF
jgi:EAL domain-containing protein (putative c-di-GMP-specific phosphodiesterase class I)